MEAYDSRWEVDRFHCGCLSGRLGEQRVLAGSGVPALAPSGSVTSVCPPNRTSLCPHLMGLSGGRGAAQEPGQQRPTEQQLRLDSLPQSVNGHSVLLVAQAKALE